jgi:hypothetical protein
MAKVGKYLPIVIAVLVGLFFQAIFIVSDINDTPEKAAVEFAQAYYLMDDDAMEERLCSAAAATGMIDDYLYGMGKQAADRGFAPKYLKTRLSGIKTHTLEMTEETAKIKIVAKKWSSINPVFEVVGKLFCLTKAHDVEKTFDLVKENDCWRVCGQV